MKSKRGDADNGRYAAAAIAGVLLIGIIIYVVAIPPKDRGELVPGYAEIPDYSNTLLSVSPGEIRAPLPSESKSEYLTLGDITVDVSPEQSISLLKKDPFEISDGMSKKIYERDIKFNMDDLVSANLKFNIENSEGMGIVRVELNTSDYALYASVPSDRTRQISVDLPIDQLDTISKLTISVEKKQGGWHAILLRYLKTARPLYPLPAPVCTWSGTIIPFYLKITPPGMPGPHVLRQKPLSSPNFW